MATITINTIENVKHSELIEDINESNFTQVDELFVDSSGFGGTSEPALTQQQMFDKLNDLCNKYGELHTFLNDVGQFQVYVGIYKKD